MKGAAKVVCVTAYDAPFARLADRADVDLILVGDSVGNVVLGYENTLPVTLEDMVHHTAAVRRGTQKALLASDMPFGSYGGSIEQSVESAVALVRAGAEAVKLEGDYPEEIAAIVKVGIPVMGHLGMTPQSVNNYGGFKVQGRGAGASTELIERVRRLEAAGAFCIVLELVPAAVAAEVTAAATVPTIGIGAGPACDGQIQVLYDLLGISDEAFRHVHRFADVGATVEGALCDYAEGVRVGAFPKDEQSFS